MSTLTQSAPWKALAAHARARPDLLRLFADEPGRENRLSISFGALFLDYSKQLVSGETLELLLGLARQTYVTGWRDLMFSGEAINATEKRAVLHPALRSDADEFPPGKSVMHEVRETRSRMREFVDAMRSGKLTGATGKRITDVVNLGIGGSDLGPRMVVEALRALVGTPRAHFVANVDPAELAAVLAPLDPETTFFIIASKTFTTSETLDNARRAEEWLRARISGESSMSRHFAAVTANVAGAKARGIPEAGIFPFWDWVGGRYSVWSAVGLSAALAVGFEAFEELLEGGREMDQHFRTAPIDSNMPVILGLLGVWNVNFLGARSHAILPYSDELKQFPAYLQQLEMESNGKRVDRDEKEVDYDTAPVIWGSTGTVSQHSFHQLLHMGTPFVPVDFIVPVHGRGDPASHAMLVENALAQASALMLGTEPGLPPHAVCPGNRPSSTILMDSVSPRALGQLIALYEHKVFVQGIVWNINSFDQWGVELGKKIAKSLGDPAARPTDPSTAALLERVRRQAPGAHHLRTNQGSTP
jgi:glucose-6-phosphate isomerase